jgi:hypothetical protein
LCGGCLAVEVGRDLEFGYFLTPTADDPARLVAAAQELDELGNRSSHAPRG